MTSYRIDPGGVRRTLAVVEDRSETLRGTLDAYGSTIDSWGEVVGGAVAAALDEFREEAMSEAVGIKGVILSGLAGVNTALRAFESGDEEMAGTHQRSLGAVGGSAGWGGSLSGGVSAVSSEALMFDPAAFGASPRESAETTPPPGQGEMYGPPVPAPEPPTPASGDSVRVSGDAKGGE